MPFETTDKTCQLYWQLKRIEPATENTPEKVEILAEGNLALTEPEFELWSADNTYLESIVLEKLSLTRKID